MINFKYKPKSKDKLEITYTGEVDLEVSEREIIERIRKEKKEALVKELEKELLLYPEKHFYYYPRPNNSYELALRDGVDSFIHALASRIVESIDD